MATPDATKHEAANGWSSGTHLTRGSRVVGNLVFETAARIDGTVQGEILATGHHLIISETAEVNARIEALSLVMLGNVTGSIKAKRIEIGASAKFSGDLIAPNLIVEEGSVLNCHFSMRETSPDSHKSQHAEVVELLESVMQKEEDPSQQTASFFSAKRTA